MSPSAGTVPSFERPPRSQLWPPLLLSALCVLGGIYLVASDVPAPDGQGAPSRGAATSGAPSSSSTAAPLPLIACVDSEETSFAWAGHRLCDRVESATHGRLRLRYAAKGAFDGRNYDELSIVHEVQNGHLAMAIVTCSPLSNIDPDYEIFDLPFLFKSNAEIDRVIEGPVGDTLLTGLEAGGLKGLGLLDLGFRIFASATPMPTLADFKNKKVRVMQTATSISMGHLLGCEPVPAPVERIIPMGKKGYIDAADRTYATFWDFKGYEVHRYITETYHTHGIKAIIANLNWFTGLPKDQQAALMAAVPEVEKGQRERLRAEDEKAKKLCLAHGIQISVLSAEERERFRRACQPLYGEYEKLRGSSLLQEIQAIQASLSPPAAPLKGGPSLSPPAARPSPTP